MRAGNDSGDADRLGLTATIIASVFAAVIGAGVGIITTFTHRLLPPLGLIAGLLIVGALIAGFRLVFDSRIIAGAAAVGVLAAIAVLALPGAGGSVLVADGLARLRLGSRHRRSIAVVGGRLATNRAARDRIGWTA